MNLKKIFSDFFGLNPPKEEDKEKYQSFLDSLPNETEKEKTVQSNNVVKANNPTGNPSAEKEVKSDNKENAEKSESIVPDEKYIALEKQVKQLQTLLEQKQMSENEALIEALLNNAVQQNKIAPLDEVSHNAIREFAKKDLNMAKMYVDKLPVINAKQRIANVNNDANKKQPGDVIRSSYIGASVPQKRAAEIEAGLKNNPNAVVGGLS